MPRQWRLRVRCGTVGRRSLRLRSCSATATSRRSRHVLARMRISTLTTNIAPTFPPLLRRVWHVASHPQPRHVVWECRLVANPRVFVVHLAQMRELKGDLPKESMLVESTSRFVIFPIKYPGASPHALCAGVADLQRPALFRPVHRVLHSVSCAAVPSVVDHTCLWRCAVAVRRGRVSMGEFRRNRIQIVLRAQRSPDVPGPLLPRAALFQRCGRSTRRLWRRSGRWRKWISPTT